MSKYIIWRLYDSDLNLWLPTDCETFEQAADGWLECTRGGTLARITEEVPIGLRDMRAAQSAKKSPPQSRGFHNGSGAEQVSMALRAAPDGLSRKQLAETTGLLKTNASAIVAGLKKRDLVRSEQRPVSAERGTGATGKDTVAVYFWIGAI